jgi:hypothetical protein
MSNRDDFSEKTKRALAARADWGCSFTGCTQRTVGPSEEAPDGVAMIGEAAHICGAASGPGSRRYDPDMTPEQRSSIENGIWLCATHARLIDRDEVTYDAAKLRAMKRERETACSRALELRSDTHASGQLFAIGPDIICTGDCVSVSEAAWSFNLEHLIAGDRMSLGSYIGGFAGLPAAARYVLSNEQGDGRTLSGAPTLTKEGSGFRLLCPVLPSFPRVDVQNLGSDMALHPETGDIYADKGGIARVSGLAYLPQKVQTLLSLQQGESPFHPTFGVRFFEYLQTYKQSAWLDRLLMLEVVRQASIPFEDALNKRLDTPLRCVTHVRGLEVLSDIPVKQRIPMRIELDVQGLGRWQGDVRVFIPTQEQMERQAATRKQWDAMLRGTRP